MISRRLASLLLVLPVLPTAAACSDGGVTTKDSARLIAASGSHVVVAASSETETPSLGCGGGGDPQLGPSVLFVSDDSGVHFDRVMPDDARPLTRIGVKDGIFYGLAQDAGSFAIVTSADGRTWTQVATHEGESHDLSITASGIAVAHATGVMTSTDGITWLDHAIAQGLYSPSVAQVGDQVVVSMALSSTLHIRSHGEWVSRTVPSMTSIWELIPVEGAVLATGTASYDGGPTVFTIARIDLAHDTAPTYVEGYTTRSVVTPAGLLDYTGFLAPIDGTVVGTLEQFIEPFQSAMVDGQRVQLLRDGKVAISVDGGHTYGAPVALPISAIEE